MSAAIIFTGFICLLITGMLYPAEIKSIRFSFPANGFYYVSGAVTFVFSLLPGYFIHSFILFLLSGALFWSGSEIGKQASGRRSRNGKT